MISNQLTQGQHNANAGPFLHSVQRGMATMWKVSSTMPITLGNDSGYGFNIIDERGRSVVSFGYWTQQDADIAADRIRLALQNVASVKVHA
jgi:hypothetical protein